MSTVHDLLRGKDVRLRGVRTIRPDDSLRAAALMMDDSHIGAVVVTDESGEVVGIVSQKDVTKAVARTSDVRTIKVQDVMSAPVFSCSPESSVERVMEIMTERYFRHLPVLEGGALVGLISIGDVLRYHIVTVRRRVHLEGADANSE